MAVHLDPAEPVPLDGLAHEVGDPARVALRVDERESVEPTRPRGNDPPDLAVGDGVVGVEGGEEDRAIDSGPRGARADTGRGAPRCPTAR